MKTIKITIFLLIFLSINIFAQKINGIILQADDKPVEFATIMLMKLPDSTFLKGAVADVDGKFEIDVDSNGDFFINVSAIGFEQFKSNTFSLLEDDLILPNIKLNPSSTELKAINVVATKPIIEVKPDRTVFNVENSPNTVGLNALEVLRKSPGINVDKDDNILLKGRSNVTVYINGKPSQMSGKDLAAMLKGMNSSDIEAIEIISNPGAQFDAEGNGGIVNIRLKKNKKMGYNGTISAGFAQGITPKYDAAASLNYRDGKLNLFSNYSYFNGSWHNEMNLNTTSGNTYFSQKAPNDWLGIGNNYKIGADYGINSKNSIGFIINGNVGKSESNSNSRTTISNLSNGKIDSVLIAKSISPSTNYNINYNLNYRFADTLGHELSFDADYGQFKNTGESYQPNIYKNSDETQILSSIAYRNNTPANIDIKSIKADYNQNFWKGKFSMGAKVSRVNTVNTFDFYNVLNDDSNVLDPNRSNKFSYTEGINAAYINYQRPITKKWNMQFGLRGEQTISVGDLQSYKPQNSKNVDTTYFNLFPSSSLSYNLNEKNAFNLTYRRSIDRPDYRDLNPFENRIDELTFEKGNPFLRPMITNSIELGHTYRYAMNTTIGYSHTDDFFTQITDRRYDSLSMKESFYITKANLATRDNYSISISTPIPIKKWWESYVSVWYNYSMNKADFGDGKIVNLGAGQGGVWMQNTFNVGKGWSLEQSGWFNTGGLWGIFKSSPQGMMDLGVKKSLWDGKGTINLSFTDVFKTARWKAKTQLGMLLMNGNGAWEGQQLKINFSYRFGNQDLKINQHKTGLEDEKNRVKTGKG